MAIFEVILKEEMQKKIPKESRAVLLENLLTICNENILKKFKQTAKRRELIKKIYKNFMSIQGKF